MPLIIINIKRIVFYTTNIFVKEKFYSIPNILYFLKSLVINKMEIPSIP